MPRSAPVPLRLGAPVLLAAWICAGAAAAGPPATGDSATASREGPLLVVEMGAALLAAGCEVPGQGPEGLPGAELPGALGTDLVLLTPQGGRDVSLHPRRPTCLRGECGEHQVGVALVESPDRERDQEGAKAVPPGTEGVLVDRALLAGREPVGLVHRTTEGQDPFGSPAHPWRATDGPLPPACRSDLAAADGRPDLPGAPAELPALRTCHGYFPASSPAGRTRAAASGSASGDGTGDAPGEGPSTPDHGVQVLGEGIVQENGWPLYRRVRWRPLTRTASGDRSWVAGAWSDALPPGSVLEGVTRLPSPLVTLLPERVVWLQQDGICCPSRSSAWITFAPTVAGRPALGSPSGPRVGGRWRGGHGQPCD